ncbi:hypothetical protein EVAR_67651_1 [Eumeta japonica]|uniref:Uncharacterized protein n=1 Tax=Eumeta variegata TaxID=151549 RepID=A0A4C1Z9Q6_EUMVA|nr:hypothetical protein EVAR_67651_1 [Eumeta japonica]
MVADVLSALMTTDFSGLPALPQCRFCDTKMQSRAYCAHVVLAVAGGHLVTNGRRHLITLIFLFGTVLEIGFRGNIINFVCEVASILRYYAASRNTSRIVTFYLKRHRSEHISLDGKYGTLTTSALGWGAAIPAPLTVDNKNAANLRTQCRHLLPRLKMIPVIYNGRFRPAPPLPVSTRRRPAGTNKVAGAAARFTEAVSTSPAHPFPERAYAAYR